MKSTFRFFAALVFAASLIAACKPDPVDPDPTPVTPAPVTPGPVIPTGSAICINFNNVVGSNPLILDNVYRYVNLNGDSFNVQTYRYYISNISFTDNLGNTWYELESYHLIDAADTNSLKVYVDSMPAGTYTSIRFMVGVDSTRNVSGAQTGALDPVNGMFWTWSSGYIMAKFEGHSPSSTSGFNLVVYHIAGYAGQYAGQRWFTPTFNSATAIVTSNTVPVIHINSDLNEWFQTPNVMDFSSYSVVNAPDAISSGIADNYLDMFTVTSIQN